MEASHFAEFRQAIEKANVKSPKIKFSSSSAEIVSSPDIRKIVDLIVLLFFSVVFLFYSPLLILSLIAFVLFWHRLYLNFRGICSLLIDFTDETVTVKNKIFLINAGRQLWGIKKRNKFSAIKELSLKESSLIDKLGYTQSKNRYILYLETYKDPPIAINEFKKEEDARTITSLLQKFLIPKEKL